jgi:hypothetical protein
MTSKLQDSFSKLVSHYLKLYEITGLISSKDKFSQEEKLKILDIIDDHIKLATEVYDDIGRRLNRPVFQPFGRAVVPPVIPPVVTPVQQSGLTIVEYGSAFKGDPTNVVSVPVVMKPVLHTSKAGRWSWQTKVSADPGFRYINVSNLYGVAKDVHNNWHVIVDRTWKTNQPVFADVCNK